MKVRVVGYVMLVETWRAASPRSQAISLFAVIPCSRLSCLLPFTVFVYLSAAYVASWEGDAARHVSTKIPHQVREEQSGGNTTHMKDWKTGCECKLM